MLKIELLSLAVLGLCLGVIALMLGSVLSASFVASLQSDIFAGMNTILLVAMAVVFIIAIALSTAVNSVKYNAVDERAKGKRVSILAQVGQNIVPVILYSILLWLIVLIVALPPILLFISDTSALAGAGIALALLSLLASIVIRFFIQFGWWELIVNRKGPLESLKRSYGLIVSGNIITKHCFSTFCILLR